MLNPMSRPIKRVLITGATGTLGYNLVKHLAACIPGIQLRLPVRRLENDLFAGLQNVSLERVDLTSTSQVTHIVGSFQPDAVIHCAASGVRPNRLDYFDIIDFNVSATLKLFQACCAIEDCHFIHISSALVYAAQERPYREQDPLYTLHPYGSSKAAADLLMCAAAKRLDRQLTILRPFSFTGIHDGGSRFFPALLQCALDRTPFAMSPGTQLRDFCAVQDVVEAITLVLNHGSWPDVNVINVGSGLSIPLAKIVASVVEELGLDVEIQLGALPLHPFEQRCLVADISLATRLGWRPKTNLSYAIWQLARSNFPGLKVREPEQFGNICTL